MPKTIITWTSRHASKARTFLCANDPILGSAIQDLEVIRPLQSPDPYLALIQSIIAQQLSVKAAGTIQARVFALFPENRPDASLLLKKRDLTLHKAGLSRAKVKTIKGVARFHQEGRLDPEVMRTKTDQELIHELTQIWGVGVWTVQMLLLFSLNRPDIFPVLDLGIQNAMKRLYRMEDSGKHLASAMEKKSEVWKPWRSVACRYLWRWLHSAPL